MRPSPLLSFQERLEVFPGMTAFHHEHHLDPAEWYTLAKKFERADRPFRSAYTLEKLARLQSILSDQGSLRPINESQKLGIENDVLTGIESGT
jgi:hypothetical protein